MEPKYYLELTQEEYDLLKSELQKRYLTPEVFELWRKIDQIEPRKLGGFPSNPKGLNRPKEDYYYRETILGVLSDDDFLNNDINPQNISDGTFEDIAENIQSNMEEDGEDFGSAFWQALKDNLTEEYYQEIINKESNINE